MRRGRRIAWALASAVLALVVGAFLWNIRELEEEWHFRQLEQALARGDIKDLSKDGHFTRLAAMRSQRALWHFLERHRQERDGAPSSSRWFTAHDILGFLVDEMKADALPTLRAALEDADTAIRSWVAWKLGDLDVDFAAVHPLLLLAMRDHESEVRANALLTCHRIDTPRDRSELLRAASHLLQDPEPELRGAAVLAVFKMMEDGDGRTQLALQTLRDSAAPVRQAGYEVLLESGLSHDEIVDLLLLQLEDPSHAVRAEAVHTLDLSVGSSSEDRLKLYEKARYASPDVRSRIAAFIKPDPRHWPDVYSAVLRDVGCAEHSVRSRAAWLLFQAATGAEVKFEEIVTALTSSEPLAREWAVDCLGERGDEGVELLTRALGDASPNVRRKAASYLARRGKLASEAAGALASQLEDRDRPARIAAAVALLASHPDDAGALRVLREGLAATDLSIRCYTLRLIRSAGRAARALRQNLERLLQGQPEEAEMLAREALQALR